MGKGLLKCMIVLSISILKYVRSKWMEWTIQIQYPEIYKWAWSNKLCDLCLRHSTHTHAPTKKRREDNVQQLP